MGWEKLLHAATQHADCMSTSIGEEVDVASQSTEIHLSQKEGLSGGHEAGGTCMESSEVGQLFLNGLSLGVAGRETCPRRFYQGRLCNKLRCTGKANAMTAKIQRILWWFCRKEVG